MPDYCRVFSIKGGGLPALRQVTKSFTTTVHSPEADQQNHTHTTMSLQDTTAVHSPEAGQQNHTHTTQDEDSLICYSICNNQSSRLIWNRSVESANWKIMLTVRIIDSSPR